jgi:hypothetical protein
VKLQNHKCGRANEHCRTSATQRSILFRLDPPLLLTEPRARSSIVGGDTPARTLSSQSGPPSVNLDCPPQAELVHLLPPPLDSIGARKWHSTIAAGVYGLQERFSERGPGLMISGAASFCIDSADATSLNFQRKRKSRLSKRRTLAMIRTRWDDACDLSDCQITSVEIPRVTLSSGSSMFHRPAFVPKAIETSRRDRLIARSIDSAVTQCRKRSGPPTRLHNMQYECKPWQLSIENAVLFMIKPLYEAQVRQTGRAVCFVGLAEDLCFTHCGRSRTTFTQWWCLLLSS